MKTLVPDIVRIKTADSKRADETFEPAPEQYWELLGSAEALLNWAERAAEILAEISNSVDCGNIDCGARECRALKLVKQLRGDGV